MEGRPDRIVDYTVVVGLGENVTPFRVETFGETGEVSLNLTAPTDVLPLTDVAIIANKHESCPKGFKCIELTPNGNNASLTQHGLFGTSLLLCYRAGGDRPPITDISIYSAEHMKHFPTGHEVVAVTSGGRSADLSGGGRYPVYLTIKRGLTQGYSTSTAISDLAVIAAKEEPPVGMKVLPTSLGKGLMSNGIKICYKSSVISSPSIAYTAEILSRYPTADYSEFPLPESVPLFCLPFGVSIEAWERHATFPLPTFSTFALTSAVGQCMYGACIVFYESIPNTVKALPDMRRSLGVTSDNSLYMSKCVCLLSHWPFFSAFKSFLSALYRLSVSKNLQLPLERYVANLMFHVPFPSVERPRVLMLLGPETIVFSLPVRTPLPIGVSTHWTLLTCLNVENCILLIHLILLEQKIVLHSARPALLTSIGESLRSVLFPLQWQCTYIPMCPLAFCSYLQAPVPFIIGMDSRYFDCYTAPAGVCVVDLDLNTITIGQEIRTMIDHCPLPSKAVKLLRKNLSVLTNEVSSFRFDGDFAIEIAPLDFEELHKLEQERADVSLREAFVKFMALILVNYRSYLRPLMAQPTSFQDISELFNVKEFIKHKPSNERSFYSSFSDTQTFTSFIEQRSFAHAESTSLAFFDECIEKVSSDVNSKLFNIDNIVSKRHELPTVVTPPPDDSGLPQIRNFSYQFFPALDPTLFLSPVSLANSPYTRPVDINKTTSQSAIVNVAVRTQAEKAKSKNLIQRASGSDVLWATVLLSQACSIWYMLLSYHLRTQWNKVEVLSQAMDILDALRKRQALPNDEVCYRVLMEQCVQLGRPALAVKVYSEIRKAGIHPSAVTYGFYNKAIMEGKWPSTKRRWNVLKIVINACFCLRKLNNKVRRDSYSNEHTQPSFRLLKSSDSQISVNALDVAIDEISSSPTGSLGRLSVESVYRLSSPTEQFQGDYAVRGDSFYIADKSPLLRSHEVPTKSGWGFGRTSSTSNTVGNRVYRRVSTRATDGASIEVSLCSCSQCPNCSSLLYDEEIMICWSEGTAAEYNINCPYCNKSLVPSLNITIRKMLPVSVDSDSTSKHNSLSSPQSDSIAETPVTPVFREEDENLFDVHSSSSKPSSEPTHRKCLSVGGTTESETADVDAKNEDVPSFTRRKTLSGHLHPPLSSPAPPTEDIDSISKYVTLLRARGHKRVSSAPIAISLSASTQPQVNNKLVNASNGQQSENGGTAADGVRMRPRRSSFRIEDSEPFTVPYLSPVIVRKELESLLTQGKGEILNSEKFALDKPILYWNCVWYFSRLKLPTYLPLLTLRRTLKDLPDYKQVGVKMHVKTLWDRRLPGISDPLYMIWMGEAPGVVQIPMDKRRRLRSDSNTQLQPLVARMQCGDLGFIMRSLLRDRLDKSQESGSIPRSIYRQMLFLKCVLNPNPIDIELFDKEYQLCLQRLPKELAIHLQSWDYPPTCKATNCRKEFGILQIV